MKYRPLMILGAGSDVGKSLMVAALCRIFRQEGVRVAPFKAQNMALNSFITPEGGEMGRAQVVQAQAAALTPQVDMNPILLKPCTDTGSQVIVHGKVYKNLSAREYYQYKPRLVRKVMESYRRLSRDYELIVLEGAGSAVELNLKPNDLVNFSMARRAGAAVLLVADIDRGGVFAATIGSYLLLTRAERSLLQGFIINKFRGDPELFQEGRGIIERRTGRPVLGVVPYALDLAIPEEDSVALGRKGAEPDPGDDRLKVGVIRLPHISNYTDFDPLEQEPGVALRYLSQRDSLEGLELVILPGTKNTIGDLLYLKETGLWGRIKAHAGGGGRVVGICGGYQMLGEEVRDPLGVEGEPRTEPGLGLLPVVTTMAGDKTTTQVRGKARGIPGEGAGVEGYEIHMGVTEIRGPGQPAFQIERLSGETLEAADGWVHPEGRVWGTYLHGVFDGDEFRRAFLQELRQGLGKFCRVGTAHQNFPAGSAPLTENFSFREFQEEQLDRLADLFREHVDLGRIWKMIRS